MVVYILEVRKPFEPRAMTDPNRPIATGRGTAMSPPNRFESTSFELDLEQLEHDDDYLDQLRRPPTEYIPDRSRTIVAENDSPDIGFRFSMNPYRGCAHGCSYCYARPYHEYLGLNAGLDFETKILVKESAPELFREFLSRDAWRPEPISLSGVTDCYQPAEREFRLTRACLEVALAARQPVTIVTKNALIARDLDILSAMAALRLVHVSFSITTLDADLARVMEPRTSTPAARLRAMKVLSKKGVPIRVMTAPIIPGLNESEIPALLEAAKDSGARAAGYIMLRLPLAVEPIFLEWLERTQPLRRTKVEHAIRQVRDGNLSDACFGSRMSGTGVRAAQIAKLFRLFTRRFKLDGELPELDCSLFRPPRPVIGQLRLF